MFYFANIFISLLIGYLFHICLHYFSFLKIKHEAGHHKVYEKKFKTKEYLFNDEKSQVQYRTIYLQIKRRNKLSFFRLKRFILYYLG